jgi:hypothetical protein
MFVKRLANGKWLPVYIGEGISLQGRIPNHERWAEARRLGASDVMSHTTPSGEKARLAEERDLIEHWKPSLNVQHVKV